MQKKPLRSRGVTAQDFWVGLVVVSLVIIVASGFAGRIQDRVYTALVGEEYIGLIQSYP